MRTTVEPLEGNKVKLSVEVDEEEFEKAVDAAFRKIARDVRIPGFRPGKAPRRLLEARLGSDGVRQEAMRDALPEYYAEALRRTDLDAIAPPEIDVIGGQDAGPLSFDAVVQVRPQVSVAGYQGLQVTVPSPAVTEEELDRQIDRLRRSFGELIETSRPARDGDHVTINTTVRRGDETVHEATDELYEVGTGGIVPGLDDRLRGAKPGDIVSFEPQLADGETPLAVRVLVKDVKEMKLPEVTDEWAAEASEFETVDELRADLRSRMGMVKRVQSSLAMRDAAVKALADLVSEDPPEPLVGAEMERRLHELAHRLEAQGADLAQYLEATGQPQEQLIADLRIAATEAVKADLALRALADAEAIEVTDEDVESELERLAERLGQKAPALRRQLENAEQMPAVRSDIRKANALGWLMEHVEVIDEAGNPISRDELSPEPPAADQGTETES